MNDAIDKLLQNVVKMVDLLKEYIVFLAAGLEEAEREYRKKFDSPSCVYGFYVYMDFR